MPKKKTLATSTLQEVTEPTYGESAKAPTRADTRRASGTGDNVAEAVETMEKLNEVLYMNEIGEVKQLSPAEIDNLTTEFVAVRKAKDIVEGREAAIKNYFTEVINMKITIEGEDPAATSGYQIVWIYCNTYVRTGKPNRDPLRLSCRKPVRIELICTPLITYLQPRKVGVRPHY